MTVTTTRPRTLHESTTTAPTAGPSGRMLIQIMSPGVGSSGVYPQSTVEAAAGPRVFPAGTLMYADHPSATETRDRPERSVKDIAGVLTEDARWDGTALVAEAQTFQPWRDVLTQPGLAEAIGVSIRATGTVKETDEQGRPIIASLEHGLSVDFVTQAGRGGAVLEVYESARPAQHAVEALPGGLVADDLARRLDAALGPYTYVQDWTDEWVVWNDYDGDEHTTWQQTYTADTTGRITLTGTPQRVARRVTYDAIDVPSDQAGITQENHHTEENTRMGTIQIDEAEHTRLQDRAGQVDTLESERDAALERATAAEAQIAEAHKAADAATVDRLIAGAEVAFSVLEAKGLRADLPTTDDGRLDAAAFEEAVKNAAAAKAEAQGIGRPYGVGESVRTGDTPMTEAELNEALGIPTSKES